MVLKNSLIIKQESSNEFSDTLKIISSLYESMHEDIHVCNLYHKDISFFILSVMFITWRFELTRTYPQANNHHHIALYTNHVSVHQRFRCQEALKQLNHNWLIVIIQFLLSTSQIDGGHAYARCERVLWNEMRLKVMNVNRKSAHVKL